MYRKIHIVKLYTLCRAHTLTLLLISTYAPVVLQLGYYHRY